MLIAMALTQKPETNVTSDSSLSLLEFINEQI